MKILLTNDDSHDSPLLEFIISKLKEFAELVICVPKHEQSWKAKSITRFGYLHLQETEIFGHKAFTVDGTPADCVDIGIYHCFNGAKPDLVVSGINAGLNTGTAFLFSSGTVGACFEANIAGIPAVALSQQLDAATFKEYLMSRSYNAAILKRLKQQTKSVLDLFFTKFLADKEFFQKSITYNVNFPFVAEEPLRFEACPINQSRYFSCFQERENGTGGSQYLKRFEHQLREKYFSDAADSDLRQLEGGKITITPLDMMSFGQLSEKEKEEINGMYR